MFLYTKVWPKLNTTSIINRAFAAGMEDYRAIAYERMFRTNGGTVVGYMPLSLGKDSPAEMYAMVCVEGEHLPCPFLDNELDPVPPIGGMAGAPAPSPLVYPGSEVTLVTSEKDACKKWLLENWFGDPSMEKQADDVVNAIMRGTTVLDISKTESDELAIIKTDIGQFSVPSDFLWVDEPPF